MANWRDCIQAQVRDLRIAGEIIFGSGTSLSLTGDDIAAVTVNEGTDGMLAPGSVLSAECTLDLVNDAGQWLPGGSSLGNQELIGATVTLQIGVVSGGETLWRDLGCFQAESASICEAEARVRVKCTDSIASELSDVFTDTAVYPATLQQVWNGLIACTRYVFSGNIPNGSAVIDAEPDWNGATLREAMGRIAEAAGCFVQIDRSGNLQLKRIWNAEDAAYAIGTDAYMKLERDLLSYGPLDALRLIPCGEDAQERIYYSDEEQTALFVQEIANNPLFADGGAHLDALAQGALACTAGFQTRQMRFEWRGDPELHIGDRIALTDVSGSTYTGVLSRQSIRYSLGLSADCSCVVPADADTGVRRAITPEGGLNASRLVGAVDGNLLSVGSVTTNKLAAGAVTAEKVASGVMETKLLDAVNAVIQELDVGHETVDTLEAAFAELQVLIAGSATFDRATVGHLIASVFNLDGSGAAEDVYIYNLVVTYAQLASALIQNLALKGDDGHYYRISVSGGQLTPVQIPDQRIDEQTGMTTDGTRALIESALSQLDMTSGPTIKGLVGVINRIFASVIDTDILFARQGVIDTLYTGRMYGIGAVKKSMQEFMQDFDDLSIGGRNYIRNSRSLADAELVVTSGVYQIGSRLHIVSGVTATQSGSVLSIE